MKSKFLLKLKFKIKALQIKYNLRREYFTLLLPSLLSILILIYGMHSSVAGGSVGSVKNATEENYRLKAYEELVKKMEMKEENKTIKKIETPQPKEEETPQVSPKEVEENATKEKNVTNREEENLLELLKTPEGLIVLAILIALTPYSIDVTLQERKRRKYEKDFADFLFELSELIRGGIDPIKGLRTLAEKNLGSITKFVRIAAKQTELGYSFEYAIKNLAENLKSNLIKNYSDLVVQAYYSGGPVSTLIQKASSDMKTIIAIESEKRAGMRQYLFILYFAQIILVALCIIIAVQFLPGLKEIGKLSAGVENIRSLSFLGRADISQVDVKRNLLHLVLINAVLSGLIIGKITEGSIKHGLKHSLILLVTSYLAWSSFAVTEQPMKQFKVEISCDTEGYTGLPMKSPLIVKVTDDNGNPQENVLVKFSISGDGKVIPESTLTDSEGIAKAMVILGSKEGIYTITVKVGKIEKTVNVIAKSG